MDLFKFGLRHILGLIMPGAIIVLVGAYIFLSSLNLIGLNTAEYLWLKDQQFFAFVIFFTVSYILGAIFRLKAADVVDKESKKKLLKDFFKTHKLSENQIKELIETKEKILGGDYNVKLPKFFRDWIWREEDFPYNIWEFIKFKESHPEEFSSFFRSYQKCMTPLEGASGKEFFNYCKMVIIHSSQSLGSPLKEEIELTEATVRFFAGTYFALKYSLLVLGAFLLSQLVALGVQISQGITIGTNLYLHICLTLALLSLSYLMNRSIRKEFRIRRFKEVDSVYDAFFLVHRHPKTCPECSEIVDTLNNDNQLKYTERKKLLEDALSISRKPGETFSAVNLDTLRSLMKSRSKTHTYLSSIYFAGSFNDHPYFINNDKFAIGIAVLPEDEKKAGNWKKHPHQEEVITVVEGSLNLEIKKDDKTVENILKEGDVKIIEKNQCHRVLPIENGNNHAIYIFLKTNPSKEPRGEDC
ncbi:MAG: hypothetical protein CV087_24240 [Candidatus Brocadia sp. WS118]|nr:MAG: hypothetical protein CV087_24240 [Candidatus Brocadia sp. WS118]